MQRESDIQNTTTSLAVSGDADTRTSLIPALTGCGLQAIVASGGNDALKILSERKVEIVISDVNLPDTRIVRNVVAKGKAVGVGIRCAIEVSERGWDSPRIYTEMR